MPDLSRFHDAQAATYATALKELAGGRKRSHWMWYIFPQLRGLGQSSTARFYGIADREEARAYLADPLLGPRLIACIRAVLQHPGSTAADIMGPVDALKLRSCATLFGAAGGGSDFARILDTFYGGLPCPATLDMLGRSGPSSGEE